MKLKNIFIAASLALCATSAYAVDAKDLRVYINPGHGSWTSGDRPMGTVKHGANNPSAEGSDTTNFYESNTNLQKGLALFYKLKEMGLQHNGKNALDLTQNIVMSHIECGPYPTIKMGGDATLANAYNRNLSEIAAEVEFNNFDLFISIHSNAATEGTNTNFPLFLYRGTDSEEGNVGSIAVSKACWPHLFGLGHQQWTSYSLTNTNVRGDHSFYGNPGTAKYVVNDPNYVFDETDKFSEYREGTGEDPDTVCYTGYLGVIKHGCPGFLAEGYFHTYQPARHRYMNWDVCHLEGEAYAYGVNDYFGLGYEEKEGVIYGIVRDKDAKYTHEFYTPNASSNDKYKPLNGVKVSLLNAAGDTVSTYTTDDEWNGVFVFRVEPGTYSLGYSLEGYNEPEAEFTQQFTIAAGEEVYPEAFLRDVNYVPPTVVYVNYPDSTAGKDGYHVFSSYNMSTKEYALLGEQLADKTVRRQIVRGGQLYVLALDADNEPYIYRADLATSAVDTLDMTPVVMGANGKLKISDMALTADHVLVACGMSGVQYDDGTASEDGVERGIVNVYKWSQNAETGLPETCELWFSSNDAAMFLRGILGRTMAYSGTLEDGEITMTNQHGTKTSSIAMRLTQFAIADGKLIGTDLWDTWADDNDVLFFGDSMSDCMDYEFMVSPLADRKNLVLDGNLITPLEFTFAESGRGNGPTVFGRNDKVNSKVNGANYFKFAGRSLMVAPKLTADSTKIAGVQLFDITEGFDKAVEIAINATVEPMEYKYASAHGEADLELSSDDLTIGAEIALYLVVDGKVLKFTETVATVEPSKSADGTANPFAYALKSEYADGKLAVSYSLNTAATNVTLIVKNDADSVVIEQEMGAQDAGNYTAEIVTSGIATSGTYNWAVEVEGAVKETVETFMSYMFYHPRGVDVDNNFESPSFGNVYCTEGMTSASETYHSNTTTSGGLGLYAFDATGAPIVNPATGKYGFTGGWTLNYKVGSASAADLARVRVADDGRIFVTRMTDDGDFILYTPSFEALVENDTLYSALKGYTYDAETYKYSDADGNFIAATNLGFDVKGAGEDLKLLALSSNSNHWSYVYSGGSVDEYALGTAEVLPVPTNVPALTGKYTIAPATTNVDYDNMGGIWYCQYRATPSDAQPALVYINAKGEEVYKDLVSRGGGGVRVSPDGTQIAVASSNSIPKQFTIYNIEYSADSVPALQPVTKITHNIGTNVYDIAWDLAGNIYVCGNSGEYLKGFALPRTENAVTEAASKYAFEHKVFEQSYLPEFDAVSDTTLTLVWECTEGVPGSQWGGDYRFNTGTDDDVIVADKANCQIIAWDAAGMRVLHDLKSFFENTESLYTMVKEIAKIDTTVSEAGDSIFDTTLVDVKKIDGLGTAIAIDDAGNIVVNTNFPNSPSSEEFIIIPADGSEYRCMTLDMAAAGAKAARFDQLGRIVGDVLSAEGAYMWINPEKQTKVAVVKVAEGAQVADYTMSVEVGEQSTSCLAQPSLFSVGEIDALYDEYGDVTPSFWLRNRSASATVTGWNYNEEESAWTFDNTVTVADGKATNEGFATFSLQGETYFVVPVADAAGERGAWFSIVKSDGTVVKTVEKDLAGISSYNSFSAIEIDDNTAIIYRWLAAKQAAVYAFQLPAQDGVEGIVADEVETVDAPAVYYNLQGVKVVNPSNGIYIVKRGNKVSKEYIRK